MKIAIVVQSNTGNTRQLAESIQSALPDEMLIYSGAPAPEALQADWRTLTLLYRILTVRISKAAGNLPSVF